MNLGVENLKVWHHRQMAKTVASEFQGTVTSVLFVIVLLVLFIISLFLLYNRQMYTTNYKSLLMGI